MFTYCDPILILSVTLLVFSYPAIMVGRATAETWKPLYQLVFYCMLLGLADRFIGYSLVDRTTISHLISVPGYVVDSLIIIAIAFVSYRFFMTRKYVKQYPWLYRKKNYLQWELIDDEGK